MRIAALICLVVAVATPARAKPGRVVVDVKPFDPERVPQLVAEDGYVVLSISSRDLECAGCKHQGGIARAIESVAHAGVWRVHVLYVDREDQADGDEVADGLVAGARMPVLVVLRRGRVLGARDRCTSAEDAEAWLAAVATRTERIGVGPLACARRLIDTLVVPGRLSIDDLARFARGDLPAVARGVLASYTPVAKPDRELELGDLVIDTRALSPTLLVLDRPTRSHLARAEGTIIASDGTERPGGIDLIERARDTDGEPIRKGVLVIRPTGGAFCDEP